MVLMSQAGRIGRLRRVWLMGELKESPEVYKSLRQNADDRNHSATLT